jgi:hypothetical protein
MELARQRRGLALDENDLWMAATALALGATLVSRDRDFAGIDGLPVVALESPLGNATTTFRVADNPGAIREAPLSISRALRGQSEAVVSR